MSLLLIHNALKKKKATVQQSGIVTSGLGLWFVSSDFTNSPPTDTWNDKSGSGNNAAVYGFEYNGSTSGADGNGYVVFDAVNDRLSVSTFPHLGSGDFTINAVVKFDAVNVYQMIYSRRYSVSSDYEFIIGMNNSGALEFKYSTSGTSATTISFPYTFSTNTLYDINIVRSGSTVSCYINNNSIGTPTTVSATLFSSTQPLTIGAGNSSGTYSSFFKGRAKRYLFYNRALTLTEIQQNNSVL